LIIDDGPYSYRAEAGSQLAAFKVELVNNFWKEAPDIIMQLSDDDHIRINRALGKTVDNMVEILQGRISHDRSLVRHTAPEDMDGQSLSTLSRMMADEILKSSDIAVRKMGDLEGNIHYEVSVPFIKQQ